MRLAERMPQAQFVGVLVQALVRRPHGREVLCGLARDASFGPVLSFGLGGVAVEVLRDAAVALPPLNRLLARDLVGRTRAARLLDAFRGSPRRRPRGGHSTCCCACRISPASCRACANSTSTHCSPTSTAVTRARRAHRRRRRRARAGRALRAPAIHPYPRSLEQTGAPARRQRAVAAADPSRGRRGQRRFIARLSQQSMYLRFHAPLRELSLQRLGAFHADRLRPRDGLRRGPRDAGSSDASRR